MLSPRVLFVCLSDEQTHPSERAESAGHTPARATCPRQCPGVGTVRHRKIAQSQAEPLRVLLCTCEKTRRALLRAARPRRAAAEPCRQAIGSHSSQRRPWRRRPARLRAKACRRAPTTFTKDAGQRAAHRGAVPGHPRELTGLDQNRDIDDALLRGGLRLAEAEFRQTKGRRFTRWE